MRGAEFDAIVNDAFAWTLTKKELRFAAHNFYSILKPGGTLAIIDHSAIAGTGSSAAQTLHRIDEGFARSDIDSRGFYFIDLVPASYTIDLQKPATDVSSDVPAAVEVRANVVTRHDIAIMAK